MKPITLTIAGLHSFREKQVIDFETLCGGGVFGIFGPTGSGKSSILDAMTLALYGKVERASNNTQGILNHAEKELHVAFTFELENAESKCRYTVERSFKRSDELRVKSATSRLIEEKEERFVLADKTNDVNQQVQELLGLTIDDFTRAVVLPQGKFAEFLSLKGVERRQMLQRLFNLEQYGDRLNKLLREKVQKLNSDLDKINAEQAGLGDASAERLKEAEQELRNSDVLLQKREKELAEINRQFEQYKQLWEWQQEREKVQGKLLVLEQQKEAIQEKERVLKRAEQAESLKPYMDAYEQCQKRYTQAEMNLHQLKEKLEHTKRAYEQSTLLYKEKREIRLKEEPGLTARKEKLEQAKEWQVSVQHLMNEIEGLHKQERQLEQALQQKNEELEKAESLYERGTEKQKQLKEEMKQTEVATEYREKVQQASSQKQNLIRLHEMLKEAAASHAKKQEQVQAAKQEAEQLHEKYGALLETGKTLFERVQGTYHVLCEREKEFEQAVSKTEDRIRALKHQVEKEKAQHLALQLAEKLTEGSSCPVCGSMDHPAPAQYQGVSQIKEMNERLERAEKLFLILREEKSRFTSLKMQLEQAAQLITEELEGNVGKLGVLAVVEPLVALEAEDIENIVHVIQTETKSLQQDYLELKEESQSLIQRLRLVKTKHEQAVSHISLYQADLQEWAEKLKQLRHEAEQSKTNWNEQFAPFQFDDIEDLQQEIVSKDRQQQQLKERIETSITFLEQKAEHIKLVTAEKNELERQRVELTARISGKQELCSEKQLQLKNIIGEEDAQELLEKTVRMMEMLSFEETAAYEKWQQDQLAYQQHDSDAKALEQSLQELKCQYEEAEQVWDQKRSETTFLSIEEVRHAFIEKEKRLVLEETIHEFWDKIKEHQHAIAHLDERLQGSVLTAEQWEETKKLQAELQDGVREAVHAKGAAQKTLEDIQARHKRFGKLDAQRARVERLLSQHQKLQSVFKGNSFVEFIAEEQLMSVSRDASQRLGMLTRQRYAIEVDSQGGFIMRDDANGGVKRPVTTLSGGETFLTSLALALALSAQIQLRGEYPLQFFFLDEGFGTLDTELLDTVVTSLEKIQSNQLSIGVISHVQELRARLPKRLIVEPAEPSGSGTKVTVETL
ncbi:MAG TPA: AAA family ATPase [Bacillus sp. (in: firmicutes)]|nr:AAA family ATPase [Bacillus sp. (in: firmicutes)]